MKFRRVMCESPASLDSNMTAKLHGFGFVLCASFLNWDRKMKGPRGAKEVSSFFFYFYFSY